MTKKFEVFWLVKGKWVPSDWLCPLRYTRKDLADLVRYEAHGRQWKLRLKKGGVEHAQVSIPNQHTTASDE